MGKFDSFLTARLGSENQAGGLSSKNDGNIKNIYPAKVISTSDPMEQNRIIAQIINYNSSTGKEEPGEDRLIPINKLPFSVPLMPNYLHVRPLIGEMVFIISENPKDLTSIRYWIGPVIPSKSNLMGQSFIGANSLFEKTEFNANNKLNNKSQVLSVMPQQGDIAIQGRYDADIMLRPREVFLTAGKFLNKTDSYEINTKTPLFLQLKQYDESETNPFSQANLQATNINLFSPNGKFRNEQTGKKLEPANADLDFMGKLANTLHPVMFGDDTIKVIDLLVRFALTHVHTPQSPPVPNSLSEQLSSYTIEGKLQELLSKHIRIN